MGKHCDGGGEVPAAERGKKFIFVLSGFSVRSRFFVE